jgi:phosphoribosylformylglycinamidine synthase
MQAGGIGYGKLEQAITKQGNKIVILGGENYRIGMGGAAVSRHTGAFSSVELNAIQRSESRNAKRVASRPWLVSDNNPIVSIHDHGAGGLKLSFGISGRYRWID